MRIYLEVRGPVYCFGRSILGQIPQDDGQGGYLNANFVAVADALDLTRN